MFVRYFVEISLPREAVEEIVMAAPERWLPVLASEADESGQRLLAEVGAGHEFRVARTVELDVGAPLRLAAKTVIPIGWRSASVAGLFPSMDADLEIASLGDQRCQLAMNGRYRPPMRSLGRALDRALLSRVAEATVKDLLDRVRDRILREAASATPAAPARAGD
jgi:hypothetical protein